MCMVKKIICTYRFSGQNVKIKSVKKELFKLLFLLEEQIDSVLSIKTSSVGHPSHAFW